MASAADSPDAASKFLRDAACYFERRPTNGEDTAFWSNWVNAKNCIEIADMIELFGEEFPIEAINLMWQSPGEMTIGQMRAKLREIARRKPPTLIERLRADAMCSALFGEAADEIERLRSLIGQLRAAWFKGGDLDKDHVSQEALRIFIEAGAADQQTEARSAPNENA